METNCRPDWASFFALDIDAPEDFLAQRDDSPPQQREPLIAGTQEASGNPTGQARRRSPLRRR